MAGAIFITSLTNTNALGYAVVAGNDPQDPHFMLYGPSNAPLNAAKITFSNEHQNTAELLFGLDLPGGGRGPGRSGIAGDPTWEDIKGWLSSDSPAEDLPWWLDAIAGIAWGDSIIGSHNPLSISLCIHFIGLYAVDCFYDGIPSV